MKKKIILTILLISTFGLIGCNNNESSVESVSSNDVTTSSISVDTSEVTTLVSEVPSTSGTNQTNKYEDKYYTLPQIDEKDLNFTDGISYSGVLIDLAIDKICITNVEYQFSFSFNKILSETSNAFSSNEEVMKIEKINETTYKLIAVHEGNAILRIRDKNGLDRYSHVVKIRDPMTRDEMKEYLSEVEYWKAVSGFGDTYNLTFLFDNEVGVSGSLSNVPFEPYTATYKFKEETEEEFMYVFTDDNSKQSEAALTGFNISKAGDYMYLQYTHGTAAIMVPNTVDL